MLEPAIAGRESQINRLLASTPSATAAEAILGTIRSLTSPTPYKSRRFGVAVRSTAATACRTAWYSACRCATEDGRDWSIVEGLYLDDYAQSRYARENIEDLEHEIFAAEI